LVYLNRPSQVVTVLSPAHRFTVTLPGWVGSGPRAPVSWWTCLPSTYQVIEPGSHLKA
jgi:hypothetical protein